MKIEVITYGIEEGLFLAVVDGKETNHIFDNEAMAFIYGGLYASLDINDASYLSRYIQAMINGIKDKK